VPKLRVVESQICDEGRGFGRGVERFFVAWVVLLWALTWVVFGGWTPRILLVKSAGWRGFFGVWMEREQETM